MILIILCRSEESCSAPESRVAAAGASPLAEVADGTVRPRWRRPSLARLDNDHTGSKGGCDVFNGIVRSQHCAQLHRLGRCDGVLFLAGAAQPAARRGPAA